VAGLDNNNLRRCIFGNMRRFIGCNNAVIHACNYYFDITDKKQQAPVARSLPWSPLRCDRRAALMG
jgi:hypothetical protein